MPLIRKATEMGFETLVVSPQGNYPGLKLADRVLEFDTTDVASILNAARNEKLAGVVTTGTDVCLPALGALVDNLKLIGPSAQSAAWSSNKVLMKERFRKHGVPTAKFEVVESFGAALLASRKIRYPVMVKATDSSGSRGISKASDEASLVIAWENAKKVSKNGLILVEEYLDGLEFGAQAFVRGRKMDLVLAHNDQVTGPPYQTPIGHSMPVQLSSAEIARTEEVSELALEALNIKDAICNMDFILHGGEVKVLEIGARMGATCLPENISAYTGNNVYEFMILKSVGDSAEFTINRNIPNASLLLMAQKDGTINEIIVPEMLKNDSRLIELNIDIKVGESVKKFAVGPDRIGNIVVFGKNSLDAEDCAKDLTKQIVFNVGQ